MIVSAFAVIFNPTPASASPVNKRQIDVVPSASSSSGSSDSSAGQPVPIAAVVAISAVLGTGVLILLLVRQWRRRRQGLDTRPVQDPSAQALTAEELAGTPSTAGSGTTASTAAARRGRRSRRRGVRRTESGRSVKTLPEYSKEAGDEELVLVRRRSGSMSDDEYDQTGDLADVPETERETEMAGTDSVPITIRAASPPTADLATTPQTAPAASTSMQTIQDQGWGEAPTYLEAMSALNPDAPRPIQVPPPRQGALQRTASGFRDLLTRPFGPGAFRSPAETAESTPTGGRSRAGSTSALLHPTTSRFSTASTADYPSPWASTHSLLISPPVPNSALRASFDGTSTPKGGLTKEQMRFLSSNEAVNLVGIRMEDVPAHRRRRSDMSGQGSPSRRPSDTDELPPPSWEQLDGERRRSEAYDRRNLALPVSGDHEATIQGQDTQNTEVNVPAASVDAAAENGTKEGARADPLVAESTTEVEAQPPTSVTPAKSSDETVEAGQAK